VGLDNRVYRMKLKTFPPLDDKAALLLHLVLPLATSNPLSLATYPFVLVLVLASMACGDALVL
jgi:hypothetical protein